MGWFLWGITAGWVVCATYYYSQTENNEKAANGAMIIFLALAIIAVIVSINLSIASGSIKTDLTPTPTLLGR